MQERTSKDMTDNPGKEMELSALESHVDRGRETDEVGQR